MDIVITGLQTIAGLGPMVMMPIIIMVLGLIFRVPFKTLIRSAFLVGIGFAGVNMVINWFVAQVSGSVAGMVANWGIQTSIMDVGWPARAAATWAFPLAAVVVFVVLGINAVMLITKTTRTVMVDFWSYNHFIFTGALVWYASGQNTIIALIAAALDAIITFKLADWTTPYVEDYFELEGVNFPTSNSVCWAPVAYLLNKLWDIIPGINKIDISPEGVQERFGFLGEPMFLGFIIGCIISLLAGDPVDTILIIGMSTSAAMVLTPKMMQILMEGLMPFANAVKEVLSKRFPDSDFTMGIDAALTIANDSCITVGIIMVPITLGRHRLHGDVARCLALRLLERQRLPRRPLYHDHHLHDALDRHAARSRAHPACHFGRLHPPRGHGPHLHRGCRRAPHRLHLPVHRRTLRLSPDPIC